ncbi:TetR/AcrR family transcriptional regulator [Vibrio sp. SS-MA-C1-2]|uniref:TetR/AcrR family transcriptional regulator n=1 Tax=Vibrio sp. SS-MA-C1-2 TaxID=2908646 RepID=UPI001F2AB112|nr:TetR/AcrR family transcriptional regulator [Vibrio sp. SS-MA-C1-2]UJF17057.1 TetR/AcrR family transcriptional regulator [Vibrio sp. SS-MA-C1-2]
MAKNIKFDRQAVVDKATDLFWKKGFHATSMRNLQDEIDMRPGSIYSAFGSKEELFKEALRNYTDMTLTQIESLRNEFDDPIAVLRTFVKAQVIDTQTDAPNGVCMLTKTISELTQENQELIDVAKAHLGEISQYLVALIKEAQTLGLVNIKRDSSELASHMQIQIAGLRTFAKLNGDKILLNAKIDDIFRYHPFA